jgi:hypothetical protein
MKYLPPPPLILLPRWHYNPMWTFAYLMDFSQSALFFDISFQFLVLHLFIFVFWSSSYATSLGIIIKYLTYFGAWGSIVVKALRY